MSMLPQSDTSTNPNADDPTQHEAGRTIVRLNGGLGNQLFQAAAGIAMVARTGNRLIFELSSCSGKGARRYELESFGHGADICEPEEVCEFAAFSEAGFHYDDRIEGLAGSVVLSGYFQSPRYFAAVEPLIRSIFDLEALVRPEIRDQAALLAAAGTISIHVRRGDYTSNLATRLFHGRLDRYYYRSAISLLLRVRPEAPLLVFSDEPHNIGSLLDGIEGITVAVGNSHFEDLYLMKSCLHHIIANSSFSWWGAWLGQHAGTLTIAPRQWFGRQALLTHHCNDLFPQGWILL
jgi:Glycosyl transferase family 11